MPAPNWCLPEHKALVGTNSSFPAAGSSGLAPKDKMNHGIDWASLLSSSQSSYGTRPKQQQATDKKKTGVNPYLLRIDRRQWRANGYRCSPTSTCCISMWEIWGWVSFVNWAALNPGYCAPIECTLLNLGNCFELESSICLSKVNKME